MLTRPQLDNILNWEMNSASAGIICTISTVTTMAVRLRKRKRLRATAASVAEHSATATARRLTWRLICRAVQKLLSCRTPRYASGVKEKGSHVGPSSLIWAFGCSETFTIQ